MTDPEQTPANVPSESEAETTSADPETKAAKQDLDADSQADTASGGAPDEPE